MIEKLKQIENKLIFKLLEDVNIWKSEIYENNNIIIEKILTTLGNYNLELNFVHKIKKSETIHIIKNRFPFAINVLNGKCNIMISSSSKLEEPPIMCNILLENGGAYYDMTHIDGWHYVRPVEGVVSTVMLVGKPWEREQIESPEDLKSMSEQRKLIMLEWFLGFYRNKLHGHKVSENKKINKGDWVIIDELTMTAIEKRTVEAFMGQKGFVIGRNDNFIDVRFGNDRTKIHAKNLILLDESTKPKNVEAEKNKLDDMNPENWDED